MLHFKKTCIKRNKSVCTACVFPLVIMCTTVRPVSFLSFSPHLPGLLFVLTTYPCQLSPGGKDNKNLHLQQDVSSEGTRARFCCIYCHISTGAANLRLHRRRCRCRGLPSGLKTSSGREVRVAARGGMCVCACVYACVCVYVL